MSISLCSPLWMVKVVVVVLLFSPIEWALSSQWGLRPTLVNTRPVLYNIHDPNIIYLDAENLESHVNSPDREHITMIQFYLDWAEGSQKVVPTYIELAHNISNWENIIRMAAINCAEERNLPVCREYGYIAFPAFKMFPPAPLMTTSTETPKNSSYIKLIEYNTINRKMHKLMSVIIDYIDQLTMGNRHRLTFWPNFVPIKVDSFHHLADLFNNQTKETTILLLIDRDNGDTNRMILMDMSVYQANLIIRRVQISQQLNDDLSKDGQSPILIHTVVNKDGKSSTKSISSKEIGGGNRESITKFIETNFASSIRLKRMDPIFMGDLYKGLRHSLYNEVTLHKSLNSSQISALASYISVIYRFFPFDNENPRRFFKRMDSWMRIRRPGKSLESIDLVAIMRVGSEGFIPQTDHYHHCKSGYPCSLWLIFHTLTVSEYLKTTKAKTIETLSTNRTSSTVANHSTVMTESSTIPSPPSSPKTEGSGKLNQPSSKRHQVLYAMRDYVKYFYSCADCKSQFTFFISDLEKRLLHPNSSILTLWEVHNNISQSISRNQDPTTSTAPIVSSKSPWPSRKTCPRCYTPADNWDNREVLNFLLHHYSKERMVKLRNNVPSLCSSLSSPVFLISLIVTLLLHLSIN